jgi:hypothetical protein
MNGLQILKSQGQGASLRIRSLNGTTSNQINQRIPQQGYRPKKGSEMTNVMFLFMQVSVSVTTP